MSRQVSSAEVNKYGRVMHGVIASNYPTVTGYNGAQQPLHVNMSPEALAERMAYLMNPNKRTNVPGKKYAKRKSRKNRRRARRTTRRR